MGAFESCLHSCCGDTLSEPKPIKATMSRTSSTYESTFEDGVAARSVRSAEGGLTTGLAQWQRSHMATVQESHVQEQEFLERQFKLTYGRESWPFSPVERLSRCCSHLTGVCIPLRQMRRTTTSYHHINSSSSE
eukprot:2232150-Prymnesium_polylepis.2